MGLKYGDGMAHPLALCVCLKNLGDTQNKSGSAEPGYLPGESRQVDCSQMEVQTRGTWQLLTPKGLEELVEEERTV